MTRGPNLKRRGLGRGLDALLPSGSSDGPAPGASEAVREIALGDLHPNARQPRTRFEDQAIAELADSIREQGVVQPLIVAPDPAGGFRIVAGERRWRAARRAGLETVPAIVRNVKDDRRMLEIALVENLQRSDLNPIEEAEAYAALIRDFGLTQDEVATRVGKSRPTIANALRLLRLPEGVRELLRSGRLSAGQAKPLLAVEGEQRQLALAERAVTDGLTARDLEALGREISGRRRRGARAPEPHAHEAAERMTRRLQTRVEIVRRGGRKGGQIRIHFHNEEELMRLYDHVMAKEKRR